MHYFVHWKYNAPAYRNQVFLKSVCDFFESICGVTTFVSAPQAIVLFCSVTRAPLRNAVSRILPNLKRTVKCTVRVSKHHCTQTFRCVRRPHDFIFLGDLIGAARAKNDVCMCLLGMLVWNTTWFLKLCWQSPWDNRDNKLQEPKVVFLQIEVKILRPAWYFVCCALLLPLWEEGRRRFQKCPCRYYIPIRWQGVVSWRRPWQRPRQGTEQMLSSLLLFYRARPGSSIMQWTPGSSQTSSLVR